MEYPVAVILAVILSIGLISMCIHRVRAQNAEMRAFAAMIRNRQPPVTEGIDPEAINSFPIVKYSEVKDVKIGKGVPECAVCLSEFNDEDLVRLLPECDHVFHPSCIDKWLAIHATCPVCRTNLLQASESNDSAVGNDVAININNDEDDDRRSTANLISSEAANAHHISDHMFQIQSPDTMELRRSHSTGESRARRGEGFDKYALKLPEDVREKLQSRQDQEVKKEEHNVVVLNRSEECSRLAHRKVDDQIGRIGRFDQLSKSDRPTRKTDYS